jgi:glycerol kinase
MYVLSIDQGTTGTTTVRPGWVEHNPIEIWQTVVDTVEELCSRHRPEITAIGITNQRETVVLWDQKTGAPIYNAIVWQCRRTADHCERLREHEPLFRRKTGLPIDAYFSGTKIKWILENVNCPSMPTSAEPRSSGFLRTSKDIDSAMFSLARSTPGSYGS